MTVLANGCYRWLGKQLRGYEKVDPKKLYRLFVETEGTVRNDPGRTHRSPDKPQPQPDPPERLPRIETRLSFPGSAADESGLVFSLASHKRTR